MGFEVLESCTISWHAICPSVAEQPHATSGCVGPSISSPFRRGAPARNRPTSLGYMNRPISATVRDVPIHGLRYDIHLTAIDDVDLVRSAIQWLTGPEGDVVTENDSTHHGGKQHRIRVVFNRPGPARRALARLGPHLLQELGRTAHTRIDGEKRLHFRLDLTDLVCGLIRLGSKGPVIKGRFKLQVQPGEGSEAVADRLISEATDRAERSLWPPSFLPEVPEA